MHRRHVAFAAAGRRHAAQAADRQHARRKAARGERAHHHVERDVMAAHDDDVGRARRRSDQRHLRLAAGVERRRERVDLDEAVGLREAGDGAGAFAGREGDHALPAVDQRHQEEFFAAELGGDAHRHGGGDGFGRFRRQAGARADHRRDDRRGR